MASKKKKKSDAIRDLDAWIGNDVAMRRGISESSLHDSAAQLVYDARTSLGWSQAALAKRVGTKQSVISRIEDSDYHGHSLSSLQRIAFEMGLEVDIRFRKSRRVLGAPPRNGKLTGSANKTVKHSAPVRGGRSTARRRRTS